VAEEEKAGSELRRVSRAYVLGLLKAALPPHQISLRKVRMVLQLAVAQGYEPSSLYREAISGRPEGWDKPPAMEVAISPSVEGAPPLKSLAEAKPAREAVSAGE
jgi:hypothetical protein